MRACRTCGKPVYAPPCYANRKFYCSQTCYNADRATVYRGRTCTPETRARISAANTGRPSWRKQPPVTQVCIQCQALYAIPKKRSTAQRFCSTACWYAYWREHPEASSIFLGGYEPYYGPNWRAQARQARERDGHTCQDCGKHQRRPLLDVHHLRPRRSFNGDYLTANALDNLVTLCKACHTRREHAIVAALRSA